MVCLGALSILICDRTAFAKVPRSENNRRLNVNGRPPSLMWNFHSTSCVSVYATTTRKVSLKTIYGMKPLK